MPQHFGLWTTARSMPLPAITVIRQRGCHSTIICTLDCLSNLGRKLVQSVTQTLSKQWRWYFCFISDAFCHSVEEGFSFPLNLWQHCSATVKCISPWLTQTLAWLTPCSIVCKHSSEMVQTCTEQVLVLKMEPRMIFLLLFASKWLLPLVIDWSQNPIGYFSEWI